MARRSILAALLLSTAAALDAPLLSTAAALDAPYLPGEPQGKNCSAEDATQAVCGDLICRSGLCVQCAADEDCREINSEHACLSVGNARRICAHKHLVPPDWRDFVAIGLSIVVTAIAAGGGVGGGGLLLPLLILLLAFTPHDAAPLANACVLGGAVANVAYNVRRTHPHSDGTRPLISYEVALMMEPMTMTGALAGVMLNKIAPAWVITLLLVVVLGITTRRTLLRGLADWHKEAAAAAVAHARPDAMKALLRVDLEFPRSPEFGGARDAAADATAFAGAQGATDANLPAAQLMAAEAGMARRDVLTLLAVLGVTTLLSLVRGSSRQTSALHLACGTWGYWALIGAQLAVLLLVSLAIRNALIARYERRVAAEYSFYDDDVRWTARNSVLYPLACGVAGVCAGLFGIGGGIIKGPLMLEMGMLPAVSSATSSFMILFTSAAATLQFTLLGDIRPHYAGTLFVCGLAGTSVGQYALAVLMRRWGRPSLITLTIAAVIGGSALIMGVTGVITLFYDLREGKSQGFRPLCGASAIDD